MGDCQPQDGSSPVFHAASTPLWCRAGTYCHIRHRRPLRAGRQITRVSAAQTQPFFSLHVIFGLASAAQRESIWRLYIWATDSP